MDFRVVFVVVKNKVYGKLFVIIIFCRSNLVVGYGESRVICELDVIWWFNLYNILVLGKMCIRLYVSWVYLV